MGKIMKKSKTRSLHNYMNSNKNDLKKIRDQCKVGVRYTILETVLQPTQYGEVMRVSLCSDDSSKVIKTFLTGSTVIKLKEYFKEKDVELDNDSIVGSCFQYIGEISLKNGKSFSKLE